MTKLDSGGAGPACSVAHVLLKGGGASSSEEGVVRLGFLPLDEDHVGPNSVSPFGALQGTSRMTIVIISKGWARPR